MSQGDVLTYLSKCKKPQTAVQIRKAIKVSSVGSSLQTLRKHGEVHSKRTPRGYIYWSKGNEEMQNLKVQEIIK